MSKEAGWRYALPLVMRAALGDTTLRSPAQACSRLADLGATNGECRPRMHGRIHVAEVPFVGRNLSVILLNSCCCYCVSCHKLASYAPFDRCASRPHPTATSAIAIV